MRQISREQLERVARLYKSNEEACRALGVSQGGFARACRRHGIATPYVRRLKRRRCRGRPEEEVS